MMLKKIAVRLLGTAATALVLASNAHASCAVYMPQANTSITQLGANSFGYSISAVGEGGCATATQSIADFYLPYFSDMQVTNIQATAGWTVAVEANNNLFGLGGGVLHFSTTDRSTASLFLNVSFDAAYDGVEGPFEHNLYNVNTGAYSIFRGDPLIPGSPDTIAALQAVPEPATYAMLLAGLGMVGLARRKRRA